MSYISSVSTPSWLLATTSTASSNSLRPFANLDLTEDQRTQIRSIFQQAKSQGLTQTQVQQAINAVLTPAQQQQLQSDIQQQAQAQTAQTASSTTSTSQSQQTPPNPFTDPNGPFANLNLSSSQQSQISQILQSARSTGLSFSQVQAQINAVLTPSQQATLATDLQNLPPPPAPPSDGSSAETDPLSNLSLTANQKTQIDQILQQAQAGTITQAQAVQQITSVLTPTQQTLLQHDEQTAQTSVSGHHHHHGGATSSTSGTSVATLPSGVTETDIQNQVAAATSIILNNLKEDVSTTTTTA
jgi:Spy/CpxP family protein refolding chaperone